MFPLTLPQTVASVPEEKRTIFQIPKQNYTKFEAEIEKLSKKSQKNGGWEITAMVIGSKMKPNGLITYDVWLDAPDVRIDGYRFVARLDHSQETGNIIRMVPNTETDLPERFRKAAPDCEHCNIRRIRRDTFVIQNVETGNFVQVGSTCLQGFFKTDPRAAARMAELMGYATEAARAAEREPVAPEDRRKFVLRDDRHINLETYLENTAAIIRTRGWVSGKVAYEQNLRATRDIAYSNMNLNAYGDITAEPVTDADRKLAADALAWAQSLRAKDTLSDYENNVLVVSEALYIEGRAAGIAASIVGVYHRNLSKGQRERLGQINLGDMSGLIALFNIGGSKLANPRIDISFDSVGLLTLTVAKPNHKVPGSINVKRGSDWLGRIHKDGRFEPSRFTTIPAGLESALRQFAADPAKIAADYGHKSGRCCFCRLPLTDARSTEVGYGKICASKWNLPWGPKAVAEALAAA